MDKRWLLKELPVKKQIETLSQAININSYLSAILIQRGITDFESAKSYFRPSIEDLHNPFLMKGMESAVNRLKKALDSQEKILIYGDYDVDGTTAVALVYSYLSKFYSNCEIYIPDRYAEGYGISLAGIEYAEQHNFTLIIYKQRKQHSRTAFLKKVRFCIILIPAQAYLRQHPLVHLLFQRAGHPDKEQSMHP